MAMFLLSLLIVFVTGVFPQIHRSVELSRGHAQAAHLGRTLLEQARQKEFSQLSDWSGSEEIPGTVQDRVSNLQFQYQVGVTEIDPDLKRVTATVRWRASSGDKQVVLETEVCKPKELAGPTHPHPKPSPGATPPPGATPAPAAGSSPTGPVANPYLNVGTQPFVWHDNGHHYGNPNMPDQHNFQHPAGQN